MLDQSPRRHGWNPSLPRYCSWALLQKSAWRIKKFTPVRPSRAKTMGGITLFQKDHTRKSVVKIPEVDTAHPSFVVSVMRIWSVLYVRMIKSGATHPKSVESGPNIDVALHFHIAPSSKFTRKIDAGIIRKTYSSRYISTASPILASIFRTLSLGISASSTSG